MKKEIWQNPKAEKALNEAQTPLWFWNDKLDNDEIIRQLKLKSEAGITATNPHGRGRGGKGYIGGYLDEDWFDKIQTVLDYKKEHGEAMWLYDEMDWPAGTCDQTITLDENNREQYLTFEANYVPAGEVFRAQLKDIDGKSLFSLKADDDWDSHVLNVIPVDEETMQPLSIVDYLSYTIMGPEFEFKSEKNAIIYIVKLNVDAYFQGGNLQPNYLDKHVTRKFLESTYDKYYERFPEAFGEIIKCVFNDETRLAHAFCWSKEFAEEFKERKGYHIGKHLYQLVLPDEEAGRVRCDYYDVLASLYQENYFGEIHKWCEQHDLKLFAHLLGEESILGHVRYSGDYLRQNRYLDVVGADHLGKGIGSLNIKYTACGAHSYGKEMTAVEVFAGCGWDMTFEEYIRMITWMYQQGMQIIINHGFFYSTRDERKNDWPPSQFFQWQDWDKIPLGNDMIRRLHYTMTGGVNEAEVLIYHPTESFWLNYQADNHYTHGYMNGPFVKSEKAAEIDKETQLLLNGFTSQNMDFDLIHKDAVENFKVEGNQIVNELSKQRFSVLVLPMCEVLSVEMARLCETFVNAGGKLILLGDMPRLGVTREEDAEVQEIFERLVEQKQATVLDMKKKDSVYQMVKEVVSYPVEIVEGISENVNHHPAYDSFLIDPYVHTGEDISGIMFTRYIKDDMRHTLFMNYGKEQEEIQVRIAGTEAPEIWDTLTGEITEAEIVSKEEAAVVISLKLPHTHGIVVVSKK